MLAESESIPKETNVQNDNSQQSANNVSLPSNVFKKEKSEFVLKRGIPGLSEQNKKEANQMGKSSLRDTEPTQTECNQNLSQTVDYSLTKSEISVQHANIEQNRSQIVNTESLVDTKIRVTESNSFATVYSMQSSQHPEDQNILVNNRSNKQFCNEGANEEEGHKAQAFEKRSMAQSELKTAIPGLTEQNKKKTNQMRESIFTDSEPAKTECNQNLTQTVNYDSKKSEISVQHPNIEEKRSGIINQKSSIDAKTRMAESNLFENANSVILSSSQYTESQKILVSGYNSTPFHNEEAIAEEGHKAQDFETRSTVQSEQKSIRNLNEIALVKSELVQAQDPHDKKSISLSQLKINEPTTDKSEEKKAEPTENKAKNLPDSRPMNSTVILEPRQNILATRYNVTISEEYFLALREGFRNIRKILNFYLQYLEEKATKGLGLPQTYLYKAVGSHAYGSLCNNAEKFDREFNSSDQPLLDQFEKIIFLVKSPEADDWYIVVYTKEENTVSIMTPEETEKVQIGKIKVILNSEEKDEILSNITKFLLIDYKNKASTPAPERKITQVYETSFPSYQGALNYGFYVLEMMRRVFYGSSFWQEFEVDKFKSKFSEFIKYFGDQSEGPLKYDHYV